MDNLIAALEFEIIREHKLITICQNFLNTAPKGFLTVRPRRRSNTYYWTFEDGKGSARKQKASQYHWESRFNPPIDKQNDLRKNPRSMSEKQKFVGAFAQQI